MQYQLQQIFSDKTEMTFYEKSYKIKAYTK